MPVYLVTDKKTAERHIVDAPRRESALSAVASDRFECSDALGASEALRISQEHGVKIINSEPELPMVEVKAVEIGGAEI